MDIYQLIKKRRRKIAIIGMGYVGMPLAVAFSKQAAVIGFDINSDKINQYKNGVDSTGEIGEQKICECDVEFTSDETRLNEAIFFIVAVPTPISLDETPDLSPIMEASRIVGRHISPGALVVYESTVYPGVTETICTQIIEAESGLRCGVDFSIGYSPERINPGDKVHRLDNMQKIVSAMDEDTLNMVAAIYEMIIPAGVYRAGSIKVAEAAKILENCQRDINIAFINEVALALDRMEIDTQDVIAAMNTKWNALHFYPGLVGGHCIGVDPYYFIYESKRLGYHPHFITMGRRINNEIPEFIANKVIKLLIQSDKPIKKSNVYLFGVTYKENCPDIRNSKVPDIVKHLKSYGIHPRIVDPVADEGKISPIYGNDLISLDEVEQADCIVFAVAHNVFKSIPIGRLEGMFRASDTCGGRIVIDVKNIFNKGSMLQSGYVYWRL